MKLYLDGAICCNQFILHFVIPEVQVSQVT